jgi:hypothetical protein
MAAFSDDVLIVRYVLLVRAKVSPLAKVPFAVSLATAPA